MLQSPSPPPTTSPSPESPSPNLEGLLVSTETASEDANEAKGPETVAKPRLAFTRPASSASSQNGPRGSIQFASGIGTAARPASSRPAALKSQRRLSSPPPPSTYESRVSFDTFDNKDATDISFTLVSKHKDYAYSRRSRIFLCGTDQNDYSDFALEWLVEELVEDGDEIVCLRVVDKDSKISSNVSVEQGIYKTEARKLLEHIQEKNEEDKAISLVLEFAVGKVPETIQRMIKIYAPACLIVGTRGKSLGGIQGLLPGSVSKYCLQNSPVPVVVVRPEEKREKKKKKRLADPSRQNYSSILDQTYVYESLARQSGGKASETEAAAVAKAIGLNKGFGAWKGFKKEDEDGSPLTKTLSGRSDVTSEAESPSPTGPLVDNLDEVPEMDVLESSALNDAGQQWEEADDEGAESKASEEPDPINNLDPTGPEEAESGNGSENQV
ncbi:MAG: hypothetical protein ASARMPREDX12_008592 [Alectoria sarmentosa]|nr:MAG: hypothetical protein ASARMPREDX12_008592 [Alectoria sarmentosa]